jgi:hypothetical protein
MGKNCRQTCAYGAFVVAILFSLTTCDAFKAGLGPKIDIAAPTVDVSSIANGAYLRGTVTLTGSAADDVSVKSVSVIVTINSVQAASLSAVIANGAWSVDMDTKALSGGKEVQADLDIRVVDGSDKTSDKKIVVYFDNVAPVITSMSPTADNLNSVEYALSEQETITGSVKDGLGLAKVELDVGSLALTETTHPAAWSLVLDTAQFFDSGSGEAKNGASKSTKYSGLYEVPYSVMATDFAGNTSDPVKGTLYVNPDGAPLVDVTGQTPAIITTKLYPDHLPTDPAKLSSWNPNSVKPGSTIKFRVFDQDGLDTSASGLFVVMAPASHNPDVGGAFSAVPSGLANSITYTATSGLTIVPITTTKLSDGTVIPIRADVSLALPGSMPSGLGEYLFFIRAKDYSANKLSKTSATRDMPATNQYVSLFVSDGNPKVSVVNPDDSASMTAFNAWGTITDDLGPVGVSLVFDGATSSPVEAVLTPIDTKSSNWTFGPVPLADGNHSVTYTGRNATGATSGAPITRNFTIDTTKPTVAINAIAGYQSGSIGIGGTAGDPGTGPSGVAKVEYQLGSTTGTWTTAVSTTSWTGNLDLSGVAEGSSILYARATDKANNVSLDASTTINVDRANPRALMNYSSPGSIVTATLMQTKNDVSFSGTADDAAVTALRPASSAVLSYTKDGVSQPNVALTPAANGDWNWTLHAVAGDGLYTVTLTVTDVAGKVSIATKTVQIDKTPPILVVSAPLNNDSTSSSTYPISGSSRDTGGVGFSGTNDVEYSLDSGTNWTPLALSGTNWGTNLSLSAPEGARTLIVRSTDKLLNSISSGTINFFYDLAPPDMFETGVAGAGHPASFSMSTNSTIHFSGTVYDSDALAASGAFKVAIDGAVAVDASTLTSGAYSYTQSVAGNTITWQLNVSVGSGGLADGPHTFAFTAKDIAGKTSSATRAVTVDTTKPASVIVTPPSLSSGVPAYWLSGPTASIGGTASDSGLGASGVASVYYTIATKGSGQPAFSTGTWTLAAGTANWNGTIKLTGADGIGEGEFTLYVAAVDAVGNIETPAIRDFGVDQNDPSVSETHAVSSATKIGFTLSGDIADTNALASLTITESKNLAAPVSVAVAAPIPVTGKGPTSWSTIGLPLGGATDGSYQYVITVKDVAGKTSQLTRTVNIDTIPPNVSLTAIPAWVSGNAYTIGGTADDLAAGASGVATVEYNLDGAGWVNAVWTSSTGGTNKNGTWSATLTGLSEGSHAIQVIATDAAANTTPTPVASGFGVDFNPPSLVVAATPAVIIASSAAGFSGFSGTVGDTNQMAASSALSVSYTKNGGAAITTAIIYADTLHSTTNAWNWTPFATGIDLSAAHSSDGIYSFTFTATDIAGKPTTIVRNLTIDTMAPQISVTAPTTSMPISWVASSALKATGVADDGSGSGVKDVYVIVDKTGIDHSTDDPTSGSTWTRAGGTVSWTANLTLVTEENKTLWVKSDDNDGNWTTTSEAIAKKVDFGFDQTPPSLGFTDTVPATTNAAFSLAGTASDAASLLAGLTVKVDVAAPTAVTVSSGTWTYPSAPTLPAEGTHSYVFTATDKAGNVTTLTRTISVDTHAPVATFSNIDETKITPATAVTIVDSLPKIMGTITDDTGTGAVQSKVEFSADNGATWPAVPLEDWTALSTTGSNPKSVSFSKDLSTPTFSVDGLYRITLKSADTLPAPNTPNSGNSATVLFRLDRNNPVVGALLSSVPSTSVNADFTLSGSASSNNLGSVQYKFDGAPGFTTMAGPFSPGTYAFSGAGAISVPASSLSEGSHTVTVQAVSTGQRVGSQTYSFLVDRTAPTPVVTQPLAGAYLSGSNAVVSGTASDSGGGGTPAGVKSVEYQLTLGLSATASGSTFTTLAAHGFSVGDIVFFSAYAGGTLPSGISAGTQYYVATSGFFTTTFQVSATSGGTSIALGSAGSNFFVAKAGTWKAASYGSSTWNDLAVNTTAMGEGSYLLLARATDLAGNVSPTLASRVCIDQGAPSLAFTGMPASGVLSGVFSLSGTASDAADASLPGSTNGVASVLLSLDDPSFAVAHIGTVSTDLRAATAWSYDLATAPSSFFNGLPGSPTNYAGIAEGSHTIYVLATDKAGRQSQLSYAFAKDSSAPTVAYNNLAVAGTTVFQDSNPKITGSFSDSSGVATMSGTLEKYDYQSTTWAAVSGMSGASLGATGDGKSVGFVIDMSSTGLNLPDGRYRLSLAATDIASPANSLSTSASPIEFKIAKANPGLAITAPGLGTYQNGAFVVTGTASDANTVSSILLKVSSSSSVDFGSGTTAATILGTTWTGGVPSYTWSAAVPITGISDGAATVFVQASAGSGRSSVATRDFTLDTTAPTVAIGSPSSATRSVGNLAIVGTSNDGGTIPSGVTGTIQYQIGKNPYPPTNWTSANVTGGSYSWTISLGDMSGYANITFATECDTNGNAASGTNLWRLPISFQAVDKAGNVGQLTTYYLILDPNGNVPVMNVTQPANNLTFGGQQRISGTASQPTWVHDVEVSVDPSNTGGFAATVPASSLAYATGVFSATGHGLINDQVVYIKNGTTTGISGVAVNPKTPYYVVNAATDTFKVSATKGGSAVSFSNILNGNTTELLNVDSWFPATMVTTGNNVIWYYDINAGNVYPQVGPSQTVQVQVRAWNSPTAGGARGTIKGSLTTPLTMTFNSSFPKIQNLLINGQAYYSQITARGNAITLTGTVSSSKGIAKIEIVEGSPLGGSTTAYDTSTFNFGVTNASKGAHWSSTVSPTILGSATFGASNANKIMITATGSDPAKWIDAPGGITVPGTVYTPTSGTTINVAATGGAFIESDASGNFNYPITMTIDSTKLYSATTGQYSFDIRATDVTSPSPQISSSTVTMNEDNYFPTSSLGNPGIVSAGSFSIGTRYAILSIGGTDFRAIGAQANSVGLSFVATGAGTGAGTAIAVLTGTSFKIQGSATDSGTGSGTIGGLSKAVVYFTNVAGTQILDLKSGGASIAAQNLTGWDMSGGGSGSASTTIPYLASDSYATYVSGPAYFASIDTLSETGGGDVNGDGFTESFTINGNSRDWWAQIDTTKLTDGPVILHYVIWDQAGNATHYSQSAMVSNHAPSLTAVVLGTDKTGGGAIDSWQSFGSGFAATGFTARNSLISFQVDSAYGGQNGALSYSLKNAGNEYWGQAGTTVSGVSTSSAKLTLDFSLISPAIADVGGNGASFVLTVTDATPGGSQAYSQTINLNVQNSDTTPPTINVATFGQKYTSGADDGAKTIIPVSGYADNLWSAGSGHIEYQGDSLYDGPDPDISGKVVYKGKAWDNQRISRLTAMVPGFDGGNGVGAEFTIAVWNGTGLQKNGSPTYWDFSIDGVESVSLDKGDVLNWNFCLDTSQIAGGAATNVGAIFRAYDFKASGTGTRPASNQIAASALSGVVVGQQLLIGMTNPTIVTVTASAAGTLTFTPTVVAAGNTKYAVFEKGVNGTGTRGANTITAAALNGAVSVGQSMYIGTANPTVVTVTATAGNMITFTPAVALGNTTYVVYAQNAPAPLGADVVPYISKVTTKLSAFYTSAPSVFDRTAQGRYPVAESDIITLTGFNLAGTAAAVTLNGTALTTDAIVSSTSITNVNIGTTASSGALVVTVNSVPSVNNANSTTEVWDLAPNAVNNNLLNDDVYLDVWRFTTAAQPKGGSAQFPTMKVGPSGQIGFSYGNAVVYFSMPGTTNPNRTGAGGTWYSQTAFDKNYGWFTSNAFAFDPKGNTYGLAVCPDTDTNPGTSANLMFYSRIANKQINNMQLDENYNGDTGARGYDNTNNTNWANSHATKSRIENTSTSLDGATVITDIYRFQSLDMVTSMPTPGGAITATGGANPVKVYVAYFDDLTKQVRFRYGQVGINPYDISAGLQDLGVVNGVNWGTRFGNPGTTANPGDVPTTNMQVVASSGIAGGIARYNGVSAVQAGKFVAIGVDPNALGAGQDVAMVAWYDSNTRKLYFSYNTTPTNLTGAASIAQWQNHAIAVDSASTNNGWYVKMAVDAGHGVHLAYYSASGGDLKYAYLSSYADTSPKIATVDSYLSVGTNCTIDVGYDGTHYVPHLGYSMAANSGTSASVRQAYRVDFTSNNNNANGNAFNGADASSFYTGIWEITTVPTNNTPIDAQVSVGLYKNGTGTITAFPTGTNLNDAEANTFPVSNSTRIYGNGTSNPVVAYACQENGIIEMAQKK